MRNPIEKKTTWDDLLEIDEFINSNNILKMNNESQTFKSLNISVLIISDTRTVSL